MQCSAIPIKLALLATCCLALQSFAAQPAQMEEDEAGIWMMVDRHEQELRTSSKIINDQALSTYLKNLTCQTVGDECNGIRVYPIRSPGFNAFMMPNGGMFVQSGLLLRIADDAELAAVLGHEVSHYKRRHTVERLRRWRNTTSAVAIASAFVSAAGSVAVAASATPQAAQTAQGLSTTASLMVGAAGIFAMYQLVAYGRDQEREADIDGIHWMHAQGMDTGGAPRLWRKVVNEQTAGGKESGFSLLATHPAPAERLTYLSELSGTMRKTSVEPGNTNSAGTSENGILKLLTKYRNGWLTDELSVQHPHQFAAIAASQVEFGISPATSKYLTAKSWIALSRKVSGRELAMALNQATSAFAAADAEEDAMPPEAYREWGKVSARLGDVKAAESHFRRYLNEAPNAWDAQFIRRKLEGL